MSLSSYLASKYLTAEPASKPSKKRKRKQPSADTGLIIADDDDDDMGWKHTDSGKNDDDGPLIASTKSAEFRKAKKSAWKTVGSAAPSSADLDRDAAAADAIIASAAAENAAAINRDEAPVIEEDDGIVRMGDGTHAGLQSAAAVAAQMEQREREELARWKAEEAAQGRSGKRQGKGEGEGTVYRDATGRRIDISMRRAEARKEQAEKERKEHEEKEMQKGDVQRAAAAKMREELDEARFIPFARKADDENLNRELKELERWNDPAAQFLGEKKSSASAVGKAKRPVYAGSAPPNRYGIRPGHRWDGVDRSNAWEAERFKAINRKIRNKDLDFAWQIDT